MQPTAPAVPTVFRALAVRHLACMATTARAAVLREVLVAGFRVESEQLTSIRAQRGSKLAGSSQKPDKLPMQLAVRFSDAGKDSCDVQIEITDRWSGAFARSAGVAASYRATFESLVRDFDAVLQTLDPASRFPPLECTVPAELSGAVVAGGPGRTAQILERTNDALSSTPGLPRRGPVPAGSVVLVLPDAHAVLDFPDLQAMMTAGAMIATRPGAMPERLARDIARVVGMLETASPQAGPTIGAARIDLDANTRPALEFLRLQARMRGKLPLRTLHVCTTCRLEKVMNPDFQRLQARNRKLRILSGTVGGAISMHGVSAFLLIGRLAQLKLLDPDFVCPRCQGMTAETSLITFCPRCGDRRVESALRVCSGCSYDLRSEVPGEVMWIDGAPDFGPVPAPWPPPVAGTPAPGSPAVPAVWPPPVAGTQVTDAPGGAASWPPPVAGTQVTGAPGAAATWPPPSPPVDPDAAHPHYPPAAWPAPTMPAATPVEGVAPVGVVPAAGWHPDPHGRHQYRWWDGARWTDHVANHGVPAVDR